MNNSITEKNTTPNILLSNFL